VNGLGDRLRNRIDVYAKVEILNELKEKDWEYQKIKTIWSEIIPTSGQVKTSEDSSTYSEVSHKLTIRANSIKNLTNDMYFMYDGKLRFDINFFQPNYKFRDSIEILCTLVIDNDCDLLVV